jgi:hypothetical protein
LDTDPELTTPQNQLIKAHLLELGHDRTNWSKVS